MAPSINLSISTQVENKSDFMPELNRTTRNIHNLSNHCHSLLDRIINQIRFLKPSITPNDNPFSKTNGLKTIIVFPAVLNLRHNNG